MSKAKLALTLGTLIVLSTGWAVPLFGAARSFAQRPKVDSRHSLTPALLPIRFRDDRNAGILVSGWVNGAGPFTFAIDTGAGASLITNSVVSKAGLRISKSTRQLVGGLSTSRIESKDETHADEIAIGSKENRVPGNPTLAVVTTLPGMIDGILDPTDLFGQLAYSIDLPNRQLLAFDAKANGLDLHTPPRDGAIVRWVREAGSDRPFVRLGDGRLALVDTGSGFGLAVTDGVAAGRNHRGRQGTDLGGGTVQSRDVAPTTVSIGDLVLRSVPTQVLVGAAPDTPLILGRHALFPFKITFEPTSRLIIFEPIN